MPILRLVLLLAVLLGLGVFAWQNWLPVLPVVFLGTKTQALPLAVLILSAIASGFFTSLLLQLFNYLSKTPLQARIRELETPERTTSTNAKRPESSASAGTQNKYTEPSDDDDVFDWEEEPKSDSRSGDDWEDDEQPKSDSRSADDWGDYEREERPRTQDSDRESRNYEVRKEPTSTTRSGSVYSYSYRNPSNSSVGRSEAVYDADYRVITPPYKPPVESNNDWESKSKDDEDWGFEDDDDFDDFVEDERRNSPRP